MWYQPAWINLEQLTFKVNAFNTPKKITGEYTNKNQKNQKPYALLNTATSLYDTYSTRWALSGKYCIAKGELLNSSITT